MEHVGCSSILEVKNVALSAGVTPIMARLSARVLFRRLGRGQCASDPSNHKVEVSCPALARPSFPWSTTMPEARPLQHPKSVLPQSTSDSPLSFRRCSALKPHNHRLVGAPQNVARTGISSVVYVGRHHCAIYTRSF